MKRWPDWYRRSECLQDNQAWRCKLSLCHQSSCLDFSFGVPVTLRWKVWFTSSKFCCRALSVYWYLTHFCLSVHSHLACVCQWLAFNLCNDRVLQPCVFVCFSVKLSNLAFAFDPASSGRLRWYGLQNKTFFFSFLFLKFTQLCSYCWVDCNSLLDGSGC